MHRYTVYRPVYRPVYTGYRPVYAIPVYPYVRPRLHTRDIAWIRPMSVPRGIPLYLAYIQACIRLYGLRACIRPNIERSARTQIWAGYYISRARMRPHVYTRARIMRARGRAHAPARGDKPLICSRINYLVEGCSRIPLSPYLQPCTALGRIEG